LKQPGVMTIAGSDSGGGAGIQADLKTFAAIGVHGCSAITSVTSQNTGEVTDVHDLPPKTVESQIEAVLKDIDIKTIKIGMLHNREIVETVYNTLKNRDIYTVLDPVMISEAGDPLVTQESLKAIKNQLIEIADLITPNKEEAEELSGKKIRDKRDIEKAAQEIWRKGPDTIVITGGHIAGDDYMYNGEKHRKYNGSLLDIKSHGSGCTFSSAIAAYRALGDKPEKAVEKAKKFTTTAIKHGKKVGEGNIPVDPLADTNRYRDKHHAYNEITSAIKVLKKRNPVELIPEVGSNIGMAVENPEGSSDVIALPGRIVVCGDRIEPVGCPEWGASSHIARIITTVMKHDPEKRSAMNIKYNKKTLKAAENLGMEVAGFNRKDVPEEDTMSHGAELAIKKHSSTPDLIYDTGGHGKEPMIRIIGSKATEIAEKTVMLSIERKKL